MVTDPKPTPREIVFAQSSLTYLRTKLREKGELDDAARWALDALEVVVGAQARTLADEPLPPIDPEDERIVDELMHKRAQGLTERPMHAMQDPYKPKVGERARLVSSPDPDDQQDWKLRRTWTILGELLAVGTHGQSPRFHWKVRDDSDDTTTFIHRDAVWEPVAAQEPTAEPPRCSFRAWTDADEGDEAHGSGEQCSRPATHRSCVPFTTSLHCAEHKCRCAKPIKVEPTAEPAQAEAHPLGSALYAVCAAEPAQPDPLCLCSSEGACLWCQLKDERAAHAAEVERLRGELQFAVYAHQQAADDNMRLTAELAAARAERDQFRATIESVQSVVERFPVHHRIGGMALHECVSSLLHSFGSVVEENDWLKRRLGEARAERPMPTDEEFAKQLRNVVVAEDVLESGDPEGCEGTWEESTEYHRDHWRSVARAAKAELLGVRRERGAMPTFEEVYGALKGTARRALSDQTRAVFALFNAEPKGQPEAADEGFDVIKILRKLVDDHEARVCALERAVEHLGEKR